jgi:hypothetical protein
MARPLLALAIHSPPRVLKQHSALSFFGKAVDDEILTGGTDMAASGVCRWPPIGPQTSPHRDDNLPLRTTRFDIGQRLIGLLEWEDPIHYRSYGTCLDQGGDLTKLPTVG